MGLDMYLSVQRKLDDVTAEKALAAVGKTRDELEIMSKADPYDHETGVYLGLWKFSDADEVERATAVFKAAGVFDLVTDESPSGYLKWVPNDSGSHGALTNGVSGNVVLEFHVAYWRKANAIHSWFVQNCQDGIDECQPSEVHPEQIAQLVAACEQAVEAYNAGDLDRAETLITPCAGFFFGGTDIDDWYLYSLTNTIEQLKSVIAKIAELGGGTFIYQSSW